MIPIESIYVLAFAIFILQLYWIYWVTKKILEHEDKLKELRSQKPKRKTKMLCEGCGRKLTSKEVEEHEGLCSNCVQKLQKL